MRLLSPTALCLLALAGSASAQIPNEECTGALPVVNGPNGPYSNAGATTSLPAWPCGAGANDIWFLYVASCTGNATFDTCGSTFDTVIQAFDANACGSTCANNFTAGGPCNDDSCGLQSSVTLPVASGGIYYIRVGGFAGATGSFGLNVSCTGGGGGPADDNCTGATPVSLGLNPGFTNAGYTTSTPTWPCGAGGNDRWFVFRATCTAPHTIYTCSGGTNYDTTLEVFSGQCPCGLVSMGCNDDNCGLQSRLSALSFVQGQNYLIRVGGFGGSTGNFDLTIDVGTGAGSFTNIPSACNGAAHVGITIAAGGNPNINGSVTVTASNVVNIPFIGYGFQIAPFPAPFFCCTVGHNFALLFVGASHTLPIPCDASLIGASIYTQGLDFLAPSGCTPDPNINFSDTIQITIG